MTDALIVLPSAVLVCRDWLLSVDEVTNLVDTRVSTHSPKAVTYPYVLLQRIGGMPIEARWFDSARIQVGCWGETEVVADELARTTFAALIAMRDYRHETAEVADVVSVLGIAWNPDTTRTPPTPRFTFDVSVLLHPASFLTS
jgi:hypothetical protein